LPARRKGLLSAVGKKSNLEREIRRPRTEVKKTSWRSRIKEKKERKEEGIKLRPYSSTMTSPRSGIGATDACVIKEWGDKKRGESEKQEKK